jgi:hypothetical protein
LKKKKPQFAAQSFNEGLRLLRAMRGSAIDNEKDRFLGARDQALWGADGGNFRLAVLGGTN